MPRGHNNQVKIKATAIALALSFLLYSFLPLTDFFYVKLLKPFIGEVPLVKLSIFPLVAILLFFSIRPKEKWRFKNTRFLLLSTPLPFLISYAFGQWNHSYQISNNTFSTYYWYLISVPIGEEFLFRGWAFEIFEKLFPNLNYSSPLNFSLSSWMTSLMFALWHLQNLSQDPIGIVLFQVVYTFFIGVWLAQMRIKYTNLLPSCLAHCLLNIATFIP